MLANVLKVFCYNTAAGLTAKVTVPALANIVSAAGLGFKLTQLAGSMANIVEITANDRQHLYCCNEMAEGKSGLYLPTLCFVNPTQGAYISLTVNQFGIPAALRFQPT